MSMQPFYFTGSSGQRVMARQVPSPHFYRNRITPSDTIVLHYDASRKPSARSTARIFQGSREASAHLCIGDCSTDPDDVVQCVDFDDAAWHAGDGGAARMPSTAQLEAATPKNLPEGVKLAGYVGLEDVPKAPGVLARRSIGIEQRNRGWAPRGLHSYAVARHRNPASTSGTWETWNEPQIATLVRVLREIVKSVPSVRWVVGHEDVTHADTLGRAGAKLDPGPLFPWRSLPLEELGLRRVLYDFRERAWLVGGVC